MRSATYVGADPTLKGQRALVRPSNASSFVEATYVVAQFNDHSLGMPDGYEGGEPPPTALGYGWHAFHLSDFLLDPEIDWEKGDSLEGSQLLVERS